LRSTRASFTGAYSEAGGQLRVSLTTSARLKVVIARRATGHRVRVITVPARGTSVALRLPSRKAGPDLRPGR